MEKLAVGTKAEVSSSERQSIYLLVPSPISHSSSNKISICQQGIYTKCQPAKSITLQLYTVGCLEFEHLCNYKDRAETHQSKQLITNSKQDVSKLAYIYSLRTGPSQQFQTSFKNCFCQSTHVCKLATIKGKVPKVIKKGKVQIKKAKYPCFLFVFIALSMNLIAN